MFCSTKCFPVSLLSTMVSPAFLCIYHNADICVNTLENTDSMYRKILEDPLLFGPEIGTEARGILTSLLTRDPTRRLGANGAAEIRKHPFFGRHLDFKKLLAKEIQPPFKPSVASPVVSLRDFFPLQHALTLGLIEGCLQLRHRVYDGRSIRQCC